MQRLALVSGSKGLTRSEREGNNMYSGQLYVVLALPGENNNLIDLSY